MRASCCLCAKSCPAIYGPVNSSPPGSSVHGDSPGRNTGVGCHALLLTQGSNPCLLCLLHWQAGFFTTSATWEAPLCCLGFSFCSFWWFYSISIYRWIKWLKPGFDQVAFCLFSPLLLLNWYFLLVSNRPEPFCLLPDTTKPYLALLCSLIVYPSFRKLSRISSNYFHLVSTI